MNQSAVNRHQKLPRHIAIIMDGNGRWAKARGLERTEGHIEGVNAVRRITQAASDAGIQYLTLYTFSTENWNRPQEEVDALMNLIAVALNRETPTMIKNNVRMRMIGDYDRLPETARRQLDECMSETAHCTGMTLVLAISYSARWEMVNSAKNLARRVAEGTLDPESINDETIAESLTTAGMPDPDLLIRTGGEKRISNFLLWQLAYSEIFFDDVFWPDYDAVALDRALDEYENRERRYGLTSEQIK